VSTDPEARRRHREAQARYYAAHPERVRARERRRYHRNAARQRFRSATRAAVDRGADAQLSQEQWEHVLAFFGHRCAYTGESPNPASTNGAGLEMDHVIPLSLGGSHTLGNVVPALRAVNRRKHNHHPADWLIAEGLDPEEFAEKLADCTAAWRRAEAERELAELKASGQLGPPLTLEEDDGC